MPVPVLVAPGLRDKIWGTVPMTNFISHMLSTQALWVNTAHPLATNSSHEYLIVCHYDHSIASIGKHKPLILALASHLIVVLCPCSHSLILYALGTKTALGQYLTF